LCLRCFFSDRAVGQTHSLPSFGLRVGWCDLAMCVAVERWHISFYVQAFNKIVRLLSSDKYFLPVFQ